MLCAWLTSVVSGVWSGRMKASRSHWSRVRRRAGRVESAILCGADLRVCVAGWVGVDLGGYPSGYDRTLQVELWCGSLSASGFVKS